MVLKSHHLTFFRNVDHTNFVVTQELIDYIQQELQKGANPSKITSDLTSQGWTTEDIEEALRQMENVPQNQVQAPSPLPPLQQTPISTPVTQPPPPSSASQQQTYAGFWLRLTALFIDILVIAIALLIIIMPLSKLGILGESARQGPVLIEVGQKTTVNGQSGTASTVVETIIAVLLLASIIGNAFFGTTVGKKILGLKIVDDQNNKPKPIKLIIRSVVKILLSTILLMGGFLMVAFDGKKQALHDKIAGTYVVKTSSRGIYVMAGIVLITLIIFGATIFFCLQVLFKFHLIYSTKCCKTN